MVLNEFIISKIPQIYFGTGKSIRLPEFVKHFGTNVLLITGSHSFRLSDYYSKFQSSAQEQNIKLYEISISGEPTPSFVDKLCSEFKNTTIDAVLSIGGGSAIDAGKAISAMLYKESSVKHYLEGMETCKHDGTKLPFIAVPTSSGTGAEATKNAVLSEVGKDGFKRSLRHDNFVPDIAVIDPLLMLSCPKEVTAACGLDTLTQLLEAYVSTGSSPMTDALSLSGIEHFKAGFINSYLNGAWDINARGNMAYASLMSGIALANAGLGIVHGFASSIGGYFDIPHGTICGTLLAAATRTNIECLLKNKSQHQEVLKKYAKAGSLLSGNCSKDMIQNCTYLIEYLDYLINFTNMPLLSQYGVTKLDLSRIVNETSNKNNPIKLNSDQLWTIIESRI